MRTTRQGITSDLYEAQDVMEFLDTLILASEVTELASLARQYRNCMIGAYEKIDDNVKSAKTLQRRIERGCTISARQQKRVYTKAVTESEIQLRDTSFMAYQFTSLFNDVLTRYAGHDSREIRDLQERLGTTQAEIDRLKAKAEQSDEGGQDNA